MPIHNSDITDFLRKTADLLAIKGANEFRVRSYREAANSIENLTEDLSEKVENDENLTEIPDVGESMAEKIREIVETGSLQQLEKLKKEVPEELSDLLNIEGLGPERVKDLFREFKIETLDDLEKVVEDQKVRELEGFGEKVEDKIRRELERQRNQEARILFSRAEEYGEPFVDYLKESEQIEEAILTGSYRRRKETIGDLDLLVISDNEKEAIKHFVNFEDIDEVIKKGEDRSSVLLKSDLRVDVAVFNKKQQGSALIYFTGSKDHGIQLRERALDRDMKLNEYGLFPEDEDEPVASETEENVYDALDLDWIYPELRENTGEVEAAEKGDLPNLVELNELKGDIHMHSTYTDGDHSIKQMAERAMELGHEYIAITDHSKRVNVAGGLDSDELEKQLDEIEKINEEIDGIRILKGVEVDILKDGTLDLPDDILKKLDLRICSVHYHLDLSGEEQTDRILKAMEHPYFNILAHPTGRILEEREEMNLDMDRILEAALDNNCFLEINANPHRLDLDDTYCRKAREMGLKVSISTDSHSTGELENLNYGVNQARRGWIASGT